MSSGQGNRQERGGQNRPFLVEPPGGELSHFMSVSDGALVVRWYTYGVRLYRIKSQEDPVEFLRELSQKEWEKVLEKTPDWDAMFDELRALLEVH